MKFKESSSYLTWTMFMVTILLKQKFAESTITSKVAFLILAAAHKNDWAKLNFIELNLLIDFY